MTDFVERRSDDVYQAAEDSALLADAAAKQFDADDLVLEVGTGSGFIAATVMEETGACVVGSDLNPHACRQARERGVPVVRADLLSSFRGGVFDGVVFNPPYLPTEPDNEHSDWMEVALSGGESGREVIEPFLDAVPRVLKSDGIVVLLVSSLTGVDEVVEYAAQHGFSAVALSDESFPFETLTALKLVR